MLFWIELIYFLESILLYHLLCNDCMNLFTRIIVTIYESLKEAGNDFQIIEGKLIWTRKAELVYNYYNPHNYYNPYNLLPG